MKRCKRSKSERERKSNKDEDEKKNENTVLVAQLREEKLNDVFSSNISLKLIWWLVNVLTYKKDQRCVFLFFFFAFSFLVDGCVSVVCASVCIMEWHDVHNQAEHTQSLCDYLLFVAAMSSLKNWKTVLPKEKTQFSTEVATVVPVCALAIVSNVFGDVLMRAEAIVDASFYFCWIFVVIVVVFVGNECMLGFYFYLVLSTSWPTILCWTHFEQQYISWW